MPKDRIDGLNPVDDTVAEKLLIVKALSQDSNAKVAEAAKAWHETAMRLLASGAINEGDGISEACLANGSTIGAVDARLNAARMERAA